MYKYAIIQFDALPYSHTLRYHSHDRVHTKLESILVSFAFKINRITTDPTLPFNHSLWSFHRFLSTHLKHLEQGVHVKPPDAEGQAEYSRHDDEHQQQSEPHGEGDAQQHA